MRLTRVTSVLAGAVCVTLAIASPASACNDRDPALKLKGVCANNLPTWTVTNTNRYHVPFTWTDNKGGKSSGLVQAPGDGSGVTLPTHASKVKVVAYRPDRYKRPVWNRHGVVGILHCAKPTPTPTPTHTRTPTKSATPTPTKSTLTPSPTATPSNTSGTAPAATAVTVQPNFTG